MFSDTVASETFSGKEVFADYCSKAACWEPRNSRTTTLAAFYLQIISNLVCSVKCAYFGCFVCVNDQVNHYRSCPKSQLTC